MNCRQTCFLLLLALSGKWHQKQQLFRKLATRQTLENQKVLAARLYRRCGNFHKIRVRFDSKEHMWRGTALTVSNVKDKSLEVFNIPVPRDSVIIWLCFSVVASASGRPVYSMVRKRHNSHVKEHTGLTAPFKTLTFRHLKESMLVVLYSLASNYRIA